MIKEITLEFDLPELITLYHSTLVYQAKRAFKQSRSIEQYFFLQSDRIDIYKKLLYWNNEENRYEQTKKEIVSCWI